MKPCWTPVSFAYWRSRLFVSRTTPTQDAATMPVSSAMISSLSGWTARPARRFTGSPTKAAAPSMAAADHEQADEGGADAPHAGGHEAGAGHERAEDRPADHPAEALAERGGVAAAAVVLGDDGAALPGRRRGAAVRLRLTRGPPAGLGRRGRTPGRRAVGGPCAGGWQVRLGVPAGGARGRSGGLGGRPGRRRRGPCLGGLVALGGPARPGLRVALVGVAGRGRPGPAGPAGSRRGAAGGPGGRLRTAGAAASAGRPAASGGHHRAAGGRHRAASRGHRAGSAGHREASGARGPSAGRPASHQGGRRACARARAAPCDRTRGRWVCSGVPVPAPYAAARLRSASRRERRGECDSSWVTVLLMRVACRPRAANHSFTARGSPSTSRYTGDPRAIPACLLARPCCCRPACSIGPGSTSGDPDRFKGSSWAF